MEKDKIELQGEKVDLAAVEQAAFDRGVIEGGNRERERIKAVEEQTVPGHEELISKLKFDGKTSGQEAAVQVLAADRLKRANKVDALMTDAPKPAAHAEAPVDVLPANAAKAGSYDPNEIGAAADAYRREQATKGINITARAAVDHVMREAKLKPGTQPVIATQ